MTVVCVQSLWQNVIIQNSVLKEVQYCSDIMVKNLIQCLRLRGVTQVSNFKIKIQSINSNGSGTFYQWKPSSECDLYASFAT